MFLKSTLLAALIVFVPFIANAQESVQSQQPQQPRDTRLDADIIDTLNSMVKSMQAQLNLQQKASQLQRQDDAAQLAKREKEWQDYFAAYIGNKEAQVSQGQVK